MWKGEERMEERIGRGEGEEKEKVRAERKIKCDENITQPVPISGVE